MTTYCISKFMRNTITIMENTKKWTAIGTLKYAFSVAEQPIGTMEMIYKGWKAKAVFKIAESTLYLSHKGFWNSTIVIKDEHGSMVLETVAEKWYSGRSLIKYKNQTLQLKLTNNPMAGYVISYFDKELLSYSLEIASGQLKIKTGPADANADYLLDFVLWYLFSPIAQENMGDSFVFHHL